MLDRPPRRKGGGPSDSICVTPRRAIRRPFNGHWVCLFPAPIHPRVCGEQDRDHYSRIAEDGPSPEVIEATLAHVVCNRVEAAYARSDLFERRRVLMDDWARYLDQGTGEDRKHLE